MNGDEDVRVVQLASRLGSASSRVTNGAGSEAERGGVQLQTPDAVCASSLIYEAVFNACFAALLRRHTHRMVRRHHRALVRRLAHPQFTPFS